MVVGRVHFLPMKRREDCTRERECCSFFFCITVIGFLILVQPCIAINAYDMPVQKKRGSMARVSFRENSKEFGGIPGKKMATIVYRYAAVFLTIWKIR